MGVLSRLKKDGKSKKKRANANHDEQQPAKPQRTDAWARTSVEPEDVHELVKRCTEEIKTRALDHPFLLLPYRPTSDPSAVRSFIRNFFENNVLRGENLVLELRMTESMVVTGVIKWCWSRLQGGIVGWDAYELFKVGEQDSNMARDSFKTFIPLSVENGARSSIIFNFFDLLAAVAAHGKMNGFGGRKLSRMAGWWAFEHKDTGNGFDGGYSHWLKAADATSHLFFAYLRTLGPAKQGPGSISMLPRSLQMLLQDTEYPPKRPVLMQASTFKVVMIVESVSPTPFALLRRGNHFQYREDSLQYFSEYEDPVAALTEECRRVLRAIAAANQTQAVSSTKHSTSLRDASWSRFEDIGFQSTAVEDEDYDLLSSRAPPRQVTGLRRTPASGTAGGRPTTPSWADFLSSGFVDERTRSPAGLLPPDKVLPPIDTAVRGHSSQSHMPRLESEREVEQGELASVNRVDLDEAFWWVWMISLAPEETPDRKSAFGRCAVIETIIRNGRWLVFEEVIRGAAAEPQQSAYVAQKKSFFSWRRREKDKSGVIRSKSGTKAGGTTNSMSAAISKTNLGPDQQAKIQAAAQQLQAKQQRERQQARVEPIRRGRTDAELMAEKTQSVMTLQTMIIKEASPAMKWANKYDKDTLRHAYLANSMGDRGIGQSTMQSNRLNGPPADTYASLLLPSPSTQSTQDGRSEALSPIAASVRGREPPLPGLPGEEAEKHKEGDDSIEIVRHNMCPPEPAGPMEDLGSPKQRKKLHKDEKKTSGFRRIFGRGKRTSKIPDNAPAEVTAMLEAAQPAASTPEPYGLETPVKPGTSQQGSSGQQTPRRDAPMPLDPLSFEHKAETDDVNPTYGPSIDSDREDYVHVNTPEVQEAPSGFSRFDQGPLEDQPAFVPADDPDADDAVYPPMQQHRSSASPEPEQEEPVPTPAHKKIKARLHDSLEPTDGPAPAIERWAQIKKNAAERAAAAQKQRRDGQSLLPVPSKKAEKATESIGDETIEQRVARIKARVAELTSNMDGAPGDRPVHR